MVSESHAHGSHKVINSRSGDKQSDATGTAGGETDPWAVASGSESRTKTLTA